MTVLITGVAGFIGFHTCKYFLKKKYKVVGIDNINSYYSVKLKKNRLNELKNENSKNFKFYKFDISNKKKIIQIFKTYKPKKVIHLAAQAGVRYSIDKPDEYIKSNLLGFYNILDCSRLYNVRGFFYASSSSVYGNNKKFPLSEKLNTNNLLSLYAATKKSNEIIAKSYENIFGFKSVGMRFFTVYGPYGRPDMFMFKLFESVFFNKTLYLYNEGRHFRDFTFIDDIVKSIYLLSSTNPKKIKYDIFNIGNGKSVSLKKILQYTEKITGKKPNIKYLKMQKGDVYKTHSDTSRLKSLIKFSPKVKYDIGLSRFLEWYKKYKNI